MKIRILRTTVADQRIVHAGSVEEISERDAAILIGLGKAVAFEPAAAFEYEPPVTESQTGLTTQEASHLVADTKIGKGRRKGR